MRGLHRRLVAQGEESHIFWGRGHETLSDNERQIASKTGVYTHAALSRVTDRAGFYSQRDTVRLLRLLDEIDPDVVHLHNIHGYYLNIELLFGWLASHRCEVKWTLHDCWPFTGHCPYFDAVGCDKWKTACFKCPQKRAYPASLVMDSSRRNYVDKMHAFTLLPTERLGLIAPSRWLADLVGKSFLSKYRVQVQHNTIDRTVFQPTASNFRERYGVGDKFMILGVASPWTDRKGLGDFVRLADELDGSFAIVLVGLNKKQMRQMPAAVTALGHTDSVQELVGAYSAADVFFNPTREDNFPTVNLEAEACGTAVITYDTGGCIETIGLAESVAVKQGDLEAVRDLVLRASVSGFTSE